MLERISRLTLPPVIVASALLVYRLVWGLATPASAELELPRREPWPVIASSREPRICSDEQLAKVLERVKPPRDGFTTNHLVHALRLWGPAADFGDPAVPSGPMMCNYLLNDRVFQHLVGGQSPPLFSVAPMAWTFGRTTIWPSTSTRRATTPMISWPRWRNLAFRSKRRCTCATARRASPIC
jgi:hypothetical protein